MKRILTSSGLFILLYYTAIAQPNVTAPAFEIADIHASVPPVLSRPPSMSGPFTGNGRYEMRGATMLDLINTAYGIDADNKVLGGPDWLETDRFDVVAKVPTGATPETLKIMLRTLLAERFRLVVHNDTRPVPAYALKAGPKPQLKQAAGPGDAVCRTSQAALPTIAVQCRNMTMETFANRMPSMLSLWQYLNDARVLDQTGLKGSWDFDFSYSRRFGEGRAAPGELVTLFDAVDKQLGLKLELTNFSAPVIVVESADRKPSANPPGITEKLPAPPKEFEVAEIKLTDPDFKGRRDQVLPGGRVNIQGMTMRNLIQQAWKVADDWQLAELPKWADTKRFDIVAKTPAFGPAPEAPVGASTGPAPAVLLDRDSINPMLRALLIDRFKMVVHYEERTVTAFTLTAVKPKLRKADPSNRTGCNAGPGPAGKDLRITVPGVNRMLTCLNMTMAQFAESLRWNAHGYFNDAPVLDATGIEGAYDMTLGFSGAALVNGGGRGGDAGQSPGNAMGNAPQAAEPAGYVSLQEALEKQLGLKLETTKRPGTVLVIDHMEENPTEN